MGASDPPGPPQRAAPIPAAGMRIVPAPLAAPAGPPLEVLKPFAAESPPAPANDATLSPAVAAGASLQTDSQPTFDCASAVGAAETMICADPRLAAADRRMARAWRRALDAGAPAWRLRRDQRDWMIAREAAARSAPEEVAELYNQRIAELEALAVGGDPDRW